MAAEPVIIKRKKVIGGDGHHGGAWKVAYADFVTAMMAFFLLMWLLNATTEDQRKGIADYFNPTIPVSRISGGGSGALAGDSIFSEEELAHTGTGGSPQKVADKTGEHQHLNSLDDDKRLQEKLSKELQDKFLGGGLDDHLLTQITPEGFVIELVEEDGQPFFSSGSSSPSPMLKKLLEIVADTTANIANEVAIAGHTDAKPFRSNRAYSNWELSSDRANIARRILVDMGMSANKIVRVSGHGSSQPLFDDPYAPQNRRISIILLRNTS